MTPIQFKLARRALGLAMGREVSPWNRAFVGREDDDHPRWMDMVAKGWAQRKINVPQTSIDLFWLTRAGAVQVLAKGERLCPLEFPDE